MVYKFSFKQPADNECFTCKLKCERCVGINRNGQQCRRQVCLGTNWCYQHLLSVRHLKIATSTIPNAGKGLFAENKTAPANAILFRKGQTIIDYRGETIDDDELNDRYGAYTAPYAVKVADNEYTDAACQRGVASHANSNANTQHSNNATLSLDRRNRRINLKATKNIRNGMEIFASYGREYKFHEQGVEFGTKYARR